VQELGSKALTFLAYVFGWFFVAIGGLGLLMWLIESTPGTSVMGLGFLLMGFLLLPPVRRFIFTKTNFKLAPAHRAIALASVFIATMFGVSATQLTTAAKSGEGAAVDPAENPAFLAELERKKEEAKAQAHRDTDLAALSDMHRLIMRSSEETEAAQKNMVKAMSTGSIYATYDGARRFMEISNQHRRHFIEDGKPELVSAEAQKYATEAYDAFEDALNMRTAIGRNFMEMADEGSFKPSELRDIESLQGVAQTQVITTIASLAAAYNALDVPTDKIDMKNGGVKESAK